MSLPHSSKVISKEARRPAFTPPRLTPLSPTEAQASISATAACIATTCLIRGSAARDADAAWHVKQCADLAAMCRACALLLRASDLFKAGVYTGFALTLERQATAGAA